jgi:hypothetical protein
VLLTGEERVLQGVFDRAIEIGKGKNVENKCCNENICATFPNTEYDRSKTNGERHLETSVRNHHYSLRKSTEERSYQFRGESLKS